MINSLNDFKISNIQKIELERKINIFENGQNSIISQKTKYA
jgi:hypothetical protein